NRHLELTKQYLAELGSPEAIPASVSITIHSAIPPGIGIASSAAVFSCLAQAYAGLIEMERKLSQEEISVIGRLGSGSAARSAFDGYVALEAGTGDAIDSAKAVPIADDQHWLLYDIIIVPSRKEKEYGSTEGHSLARTSPLFSKRVQEIPRRQRECIDAIHKRDFEKLQHVAEEDCLDMHEVMRTSTPSLQYLTRDTRLILEEITVYRRMKRLPVLYTMDAGPTVHLFCPAEAKEDVLHFAHEQQGCTVFVAHTGKGAHLLKKSS
ncbi:hypothetical protein HY213_02415, partial [Candidatus Peregrinibacteria bacterium]|nr:hypothetical protein [Candidatus Peregrinibacteria bacterium]